MVIEWVVAAGQLQGFLDDADCLDPLLVCLFFLVLGMGQKVAMIALVDDLHSEMNRNSGTFLIFLDPSVALDAIDCGILLDGLSGLDEEAQFCCGFNPTYLNKFQKVLLEDCNQNV